MKEKKIAVASIQTQDIGGLLASLREVIQTARRQAVRAVDVVQVRTCWTVGRHIVEFEQGGADRAAYGQGLLARLAEQLTAEFGKGFDASNLHKMSQFYRLFPNLDALRPELSWTHYRLLLRVENAQARAWYMTDELTHQDIGQMDMYVRMYDDLRRGPQDNPTVGIILCAQKDKSVVRYFVLHGNEQLFAAKYKLVLPSEEELRAELVREQQILAEQTPDLPDDGQGGPP